MKSKTTKLKTGKRGVKIDLQMKNGSHKNNGHGRSGHAPAAHTKNGHGRNGHSKDNEKPEVYVLAPVVEPVLTEAELYRLLVKVRNGDFSVRLPAGQTGMKQSICQVMNDIIDM